MPRNKTLWQEQFLLSRRSKMALTMGDKRELPATKVLPRQRHKLYHDKDGHLCRSRLFSQLVLPQKFHTTVFKEIHQEMGHLGAVHMWCSWHGNLSTGQIWRMTLFTLWLRCAHVLNSGSLNLSTQAPLNSVTTLYPLELVSLDFIHLESSSGGYEYILVIIDHFTRFAQAYATKNKSATTAADPLSNDFVLFGFPAKILHD